MSEELRNEDGSLNAYCVTCGNRLIVTTEKLHELAAIGEFETVDVLCEKCESKFSIGLQLGSKEFGVVT